MFKLLNKLFKVMPQCINFATNFPKILIQVPFHIMFSTIDGENSPEDEISFHSSNEDLDDGYSLEEPTEMDWEPTTAPIPVLIEVPSTPMSQGIIQHPLSCFLSPSNPFLFFVDQMLQDITLLLEPSTLWYK